MELLGFDQCSMICPRICEGFHVIPEAFFFFFCQVLQPGDVTARHGREMEGDAEHRTAAQGTGGAGPGQQGVVSIFFDQCLLLFFFLFHAGAFELSPEQ